MSQLLEPFIAELAQEADATRRLLERVPADKLTWKPHDKSMTLGQLALHVAGLPGAISGLLSTDAINVEDADFTPASPASTDEIMTALNKGLAAATQWMGTMDDATASAEWQLRKGGEAIWSVPRIGMIRTLLLNHWYHHRGQLSVYLRLLDVPVPVTYGVTADENPFA